MAEYVVSLTARAPVQACITVEANSEDEAGDLAIEQWRELQWEVDDIPHKNDIDTPCVDKKR